MANAAKQFGPRKMNAPPWNGGAQQGQVGFSTGSHNPPSRTLPAPAELVGRIEEARTSAKLLLQLVQSTPANELLFNELVKEFSERCMSAQRSIQGYINCDSPPPDDDTMLTLIETNEQLSLAASKHQRAVLQARKLLGPTPSPPVPSANSTQYQPPPPPQPALNTNFAAPSQPPPREEPSYLPPLDMHQTNYNSAPTDKQDLPLPPALQAGTSRQPQSEYSPEDENPFADHHTSGYGPPPGPPPQRPGHEVSPTNGHDQRGSPTSYNPGYQSTPSYLGRQESSSNNLTMHGAVLTEEEEYARDYPATPEQTRRRQDSDVSPIAERTPVTYRY